MEECEYSFHAIGPIYPECKDSELHQIPRDKTATIEHRAADWFKDRGFRVLGNHPKERIAEVPEWEAVRKELNTLYDEWSS